MANKANEYPYTMLCPLADETIKADDCIENQDCVGYLLKSDTMPQRFKRKTNWRDICTNCKYFEYE